MFRSLEVITQEREQQHGDRDDQSRTSHYFYLNFNNNSILSFLVLPNLEATIMKTKMAVRILHFGRIN